MTGAYFASVEQTLFPGSVVFCLWWDEADCSSSAYSLNPSQKQRGSETASCPEKSLASVAQQISNPNSKAEDTHLTLLFVQHPIAIAEGITPLPPQKGKLRAGKHHLQDFS